MALLVAILLVGVVPEARPEARQATPEMGVQFHAMWSDYTNKQRLEVLDKMAAAGVTWVRVDLGWASFQEEGRRRYSEWYIELADFVVDAARERGIKVLGTIWYTPKWANGGRSGIVPPNEPRDYGRFAGWVAEHFRGRVSAWEIWNEPNHESFFSGTPRAYVRLLRAAYSRIKARAPEVEVVLGGPAYNDTDWLRKVYRRGAADHFDVMATHPYQGMADAPPETPDDGDIWTMAHVAAVRRLMIRNGDRDKPIWFTEFGWSSHKNWPGIENHDRGVTLQEQGQYLVRTLKYLAEEHPYVKNVFWYNERNRNTGNKRKDNYGLLYRDLSPKPAYRMMKEFLTQPPTQ